MPSAFQDVIRQLQRQKIAIDRAIAALQEVGDDGFQETSTSAKHAKKASTKKAGRRRTLSPEARKRISDAMKKRWTAARKGAKKRAAKKPE